MVYRKPLYSTGGEFGPKLEAQQCEVVPLRARGNFILSGNLQSGVWKDSGGGARHLLKPRQ